MSIDRSTYIGLHLSPKYVVLPPMVMMCSLYTSENEQFNI